MRECYIITRNPSDYPGRVIVRRWWRLWSRGRLQNELYALGDGATITDAEVVDCLPDDTVWIPNFHGDPPVVVGVGLGA